MEIEEFYENMERAKSIIKEQQVIAKEFKEKIVAWMNEKGVDEYIISGMEGPVQLRITYPEQEVLNKKGLAEAIGLKAKEISKPKDMVKLTLDGKITSELIENFTAMEERQQFSVKELPQDYSDDPEDD